MADTRISDFTSAGTLDGAEIVPVVRGSGSPVTYSNLRTTSQAISDLSRGLYDLSAGVPTISSMTAVGISGTTSSSENAGKGFCVIDTGKASTALVGYRKTSVPGSTPYLIALGLLPAPTSSVSEFCAGWSDGTKYETVGFGTGGGNIESWNNATSRNGFTALGLSNLGGSPLWLGLEDDGTNRIFLFSADGANFVILNSIAKASSWLGSTGHTQIFVGLRPADSNPSAITCVCYDEAGLSRIIR